MGGGMNLRDLSFADLELVISLAALKAVLGVARERNQSPTQLSKTLRKIEESVGRGRCETSTRTGRRLENRG